MWSQIGNHIRSYVGEPANPGIQGTIVQADGSTPQNISGWVINLIVETQSINSPVQVLTKVATILDNGTGDVTTGTLNVPIVAADTVGISPGTYRWRLERNDGTLLLKNTWDLIRR